jgi:PAS domain S-box-containing protein
MDVFNSTSEYLESIKKYKIIAENIDECIWIFDLANRCFKYISPSIYKLRGLTVEEAMNEKLEDCLTPESLKKIKVQGTTRLPHFLAGDRSENIASSIDEYEQYCKDGTIKIIEISTKLILNNETNSVDILGVSRDVSYRKKFDEDLKLELENVHELFGINNGRIYCFGKLLVYGNSSNSIIKWRTHKSEELFAYLLENREEPISKWKICEDLWPQHNLDKVNTLLHTTLYKMKKSLELANINFELKFINGSYYFSIPDVYIDVDEFKYITSSKIVIKNDSVKKYRKAFDVYKDHYLEENYFSWSLAKKETYSAKHYHLGKELINYYINVKDYAESQKIINEVLKRYPLDEFVNEICLKLYYIRNDRISFINQYKSTQRLFKKELGIQPSSQMKKLYKTLISESY